PLARGARKASVTHRLTIATGIGCGDIAAMLLPHNSLGSAKLQAILLMHVNIMPLGPQGLDDLRGSVGCQHNLGAGPAPATRRVDGGLRVAAQVDKLLH